MKSSRKISAIEGNFNGAQDIAQYDGFIWSLTSLGDIDGDHVTDLAVGAPFTDDGGTHRGAMWILFLASNGTVKSHRKISSTAPEFDGMLDDGD